MHASVYFRADNYITMHFNVQSSVELNGVDPSTGLSLCTDCHGNIETCALFGNNELRSTALFVVPAHVNHPVQSTLTGLEIRNVSSSGPSAIFHFQRKISLPGDLYAEMDLLLFQSCFVHRSNANPHSGPDYGAVSTVNSTTSDGILNSSAVVLHGDSLVLWFVDSIVEHSWGHHM